MLHDLRRSHHGLHGWMHCESCDRSLPQCHFIPDEKLTRAQKERRALQRTYYQSSCRRCRSGSKRAWLDHPLYSVPLEIFWANKFRLVEVGAETRGIPVEIDHIDLLELYLSQGGLCALSGIQLDCRAKGTSGRGNKAKFSPSVDRIDSHGSYTVDNVQIVAAAVNLMKNDLNQDDFIGLCRAVATKAQTVRENDLLAAIEAA